MVRPYSPPGNWSSERDCMTMGYHEDRPRRWEAMSARYCNGAAAMGAADCICKREIVTQSTSSGFDLSFELILGLIFFQLV